MLFLETIKIFNGSIFNLQYHQKRMDKARSEFFPGCNPLELREFIHNSALDFNVAYKCRIIYSSGIKKIEIKPYTPKAINSLMMADGSGVEYSYKFFNRKSLNRLLDGKGSCDDILIVKDGYITDTSFSNVILFDGNRWYTPAHPLLKGTQRQKLLDDGFCRESDIRVKDLPEFKSIKLINAMLSPEDSPVIPIRNIIGPE